MKRSFRICSSIAIFALLMGGCSNIKQSANIGTSSQAGVTEDSYIKDNSVPLELNNLAQANIPILDSAVENAEVILAGEEHGVSIDTKLSLNFIKHFNSKSNIRYYLSEIPYSASVLLNQYLNTGNEEIIRRLVSSNAQTFDYTKEVFEFYRELYAYNKSLPVGNKIIVIGIDLEHNRDTSFWCLNSLMPEKKAPSAIQSLIEQVKKLNTGAKLSREEMLKFCSELRDSINKNRELYSEYFGDNLFDFEFINQNIINKLEGAAYGEREKRIYDNFKKLYNHLPKGKYFGQFGLYHIPQNKVNHTVEEWLGAKLNYEDSPVKGKVISIAYLYDKSYHRLQDNTVSSSSNYLKNELIESVAKTDLTLIRLNGQDSPFKKKLIWSITDVQADNGVTSDYYQYYLLIRNAEASTEYSEADLT